MIENGRITHADIVFSRGFILDCWIHVECDGGNQGFGGYVIGGNPFDKTAKCAEHQSQPNIAADFIGGVMAIADVEKFSDLVGKIIRIRRDDSLGPIVEIGHAFKNIWYNPKQRFEELAA